MTPFKSITEKLNAWRRYREAVRELSQLTDRELEDIGVRRGDIPFIAAGAARQGLSLRSAASPPRWRSTARRLTAAGFLRLRPAERSRRPARCSRSIREK